MGLYDIVWAGHIVSVTNISQHVVHLSLYYSYGVQINKNHLGSSSAFAENTCVHNYKRFLDRICRPPTSVLLDEVFDFDQVRGRLEPTIWLGDRSRVAMKQREAEFQHTVGLCSM